MTKINQKQNPVSKFIKYYGFQAQADHYLLNLKTVHDNYINKHN